jgi:hypothetical protein
MVKQMHQKNNATTRGELRSNQVKYVKGTPLSRMGFETALNQISG